MLSDADIEDFDGSSCTRLIELERQSSGFCGFHLTRSKWDPYPWITKVDPDSAAEAAGMRSGECILEINGEDIVGKRISEVADRVRSGSNQISLLLWNSGMDPQCTPESLCCGPMPQNLQRLSACLSSILAVLECPVCFDTIPPPAHQCDNGHLMCLRCRAKSEKCPVCRIRLSRGRSLLAEQVYNSVTDVFDLREETEQNRKAKMQTIFKLQGKHKNIPDIKVTQTQTNKFLARIIGKSTSVDSLVTGSIKSIPMMRFSLDHDFETSNLKTKSLSTNEIFKTASPVPSRSSSFSRLDKNYKNCEGKLDSAKNTGHASYYRSLESLEKKHVDDGRIICNNLLSVPSDSPKEEMYQCPYDISCGGIIKGSEIVRHFQTDHEGPLIQYFHPELTLNLTNVCTQKNLCYVIHVEDRIFFLRIVDIFDNKQYKGEDDDANNPSLLLWLWILADVEASNDYQLKVRISNEEGKVFLSVTSPIYSLKRISWKTIMEARRGIFLNSQTLQSLTSSKKNINLDIAIIKQLE